MSCVYIYTFLKRARDLPVTIEDKRGEVKHLQSVLKDNGYSDRFFFNRKWKRSWWPPTSEWITATTKKFLCSAFCVRCVTRNWQSVETGRYETKFLTCIHHETGTDEGQGQAAYKRLGVGGVH